MMLVSSSFHVSLVHCVIVNRSGERILPPFVKVVVAFCSFHWMIDTNIQRLQHWSHVRCLRCYRSLLWWQQNASKIKILLSRLDDWPTQYQPNYASVCHPSALLADNEHEHHTFRQGFTYKNNVGERLFPSAMQTKIAVNWFFSFDFCHYGNTFLVNHWICREFESEGDLVIISNDSGGL